MEFETQYYGNIFKLILDRNPSYYKEYIKYFSGNCDHFMNNILGNRDFCLSKKPHYSQEPDTDSTMRTLYLYMFSTYTFPLHECNSSF